MKKILIKIIILLMFLIPNVVKAEGYISVSPTILTIEKDTSKTFTITAFNAIGDVAISSNNNDIAKVNMSEWSTGMVDEKATKTDSITVTGVSVGTTTITVVVDGATFDSEDLSGQTKTITVNVIAKTTNNQTQSPTPQPQQRPQAPTETAPAVPKNTDATLKNIELSNSAIEFSSDKESYELTVGYDISSIEVKGILNDDKASIKLEGDTNLKEGDNVIKLVVTAEDGTTTKIYTLNIKRENKVLSKNSKIKKLTINNYDINFNKNKKEYDLIINNEDNLTFNVELEDEFAKYEIVGNKKLKNKSVIKVIVTAEDKSSTVYSINIIKEKNKTKELSIALICSIILNAIIIGILIFVVLRLNKKDKNILKELFKLKTTK